MKTGGLLSGKEMTSKAVFDQTVSKRCGGNGCYLTEMGQVQLFQRSIQYICVWDKIVWKMLPINTTEFIQVTQYSRNEKIENTGSEHEETLRFACEIKEIDQELTDRND